MKTGIGLALLLALGHVPAQAQEGRTFLVVVAGIGGEPRFTEAFRAWGTQIVEAARKQGVGADGITFLTESPAPPATGESRKEVIEKVFADVAAKAGAADVVYVVLLGHGSYRGEESRINLPGPDLTAQDFARLLKPVAARVAFVNAASASGEWAKILSAPNRAVVTSTKSGMERNESVFGKYFADALSEDVADTDKDGRVSLLEAFEYARVEVTRFYEGESRLLTEHAQIEDTGDGQPATEAGPGTAEGALAARIFLGPGGTAGIAVPADASPALRALYAKKAQLEERIAALRARRESMDPEAYQAQLEPLLLELARTDQEIRRSSGGGAR